MESGEKSTAPGRSTATTVVIAGVGVGLVALSAVLGKQHIGRELVYDLGIACVILVAVDVLLQRAVGRMSQLFAVDAETRAFTADQTALYERLYDPGLDEAGKAEIRAEIERRQRAFVRAQNPVGDTPDSKSGAE